MSKVTRLPGKPKTTEVRRQYQKGDLIRALAEGLLNQEIVGDIEQALHDLLFIGGEEDVLVVKAMLIDLLHALPEPPELIEGIAINPDLPEGFDQCDNADRPPSHMAWWGKPYIVTERGLIEYYDEAVRRLSGLNIEMTYTRQEWDDRQAESRKGWLQAYPDGVRYDVRCLDGGAWDRPTGWGMVGTLEEAIHIAKNGPSWN